MLYFAGHGCEYKNMFRMFTISEVDESNIDTDTDIDTDIDTVTLTLAL